MPNKAEFKVHLDHPYKGTELQELQSRALRSFAPPPADLLGRGIVTCVFDREFTSCWVLMSELVRLDVRLPVEAWHLPGELSARHEDLLRGLPLDLTLRELPDDDIHGFAVKPVAIWRSRFREVLWIDSDNFPVRDPSFLFEDAEYVEKGSLFWRDTSGTERARFWHEKSSVWELFGVPPNWSEEFEAGQLLIDKGKCWTELCLTAYYAFSHRFFYHFLIGDKDTFRLAWQRVAHERGRTVASEWYHSEASQVPYGMMPYGPFHVGRPNRWGAWGGGTVLVQRDRNGRPLFAHRNTQKFWWEGYNHFNADVPNEAFHHAHVAALARAYGNGRDAARLSAVPVAQPWTARPHIPCAWGDVFDRLSILHLKGERVTDPTALSNVRQEAAALAEMIGDRGRFPVDLEPLLGELAAINAALWDIEDGIRVCERAGRFDESFVALARSVYQRNDRRAEIKRRISQLLGSALIEEKQYSAGQ